AWRRKAVATRQRRQEILDRSGGHAPQLSVVITEASPRDRGGIHGHRRQEILDRSGGHAPQLSGVITEASLRYRWGIHGDRREQIEHLWEMSKRRNIELRIQRFDDGPATGLSSMVNI